MLWNSFTISIMCVCLCVHANVHLNIITNQKRVYFAEIYLKNEKS
jgi:hypothetical protein